MKVALVHDFLFKLGGAERVLKVFSEMFPDAPIFTLIYDEEKMSDVFPKERVITSSFQKYPKFLRNKHRFFTKKFPRLIEEFDFSDYDLVISSSNSYSKGIITSTDTKHLCYCHSPMRYAWDWTHEYRDENKIRGFKKLIYTPLINYLRNWDQISASRVDKFLANSRNVQKRIEKYYGFDSTIVYPPVDTDRFKMTKENLDYYLIVSTLTPYKKVDLAVEFFNKIGKKLIIIGSGPSLDYLKSIAGENIEFLGFKSDEVVKEYMENCRALIFPGEDDFGITPLEAMACGKPVLAYAKGGLLETLIPGKTGEFFYNDTVSDMEDALGRLIYNESLYDPAEIRKHAEKFSKAQFIKNMKEEISLLFK